MHLHVLVYNSLDLPYLNISMFMFSFTLYSLGYRLVGIGRNEYIDIMNKYRSRVSLPLVTVGYGVNNAGPMNPVCN